MDSYVHTPLSLTCLIRHSIWTTHLDLDLFRRTDIDDFEMLLIEFKASELCMPASKLAELRKIQEGNCLKKSAANLNCWTSLPEAIHLFEESCLCPTFNFWLNLCLGADFLSHESCFIMKSPNTCTQEPVCN